MSSSRRRGGRTPLRADPRIATQQFTPEQLRAAARAAALRKSSKAAANGTGSRTMGTPTRGTPRSGRGSSSPSTARRRTSMNASSSSSNGAWHGDWTDQTRFRGPRLGGHTPRRGGPTSSELAASTAFPRLPRFNHSAYTGDIDNESRRQRYQALRAGYNLTAVLNNPLAVMTEPEPPPLVIYPYPGLSDREINLRNLRKYLHTMGPVWQFFKRNHREHAQLGTISAAADDSLRPRRSKSREEEDEEANFLGFLSSAGSGSQEKLALAEREAEQQLVECLKIVPELYFRTDFDPSEPEFFMDLASRPDSMLLQEKLSHYLDLVEINLLKQISARSHSFFAALRTIQDLNAQVGSGIKTIKRIRTKIKHLRLRLVDSSLSTLQNRRRQTNLQEVIAVLEQISAVIEAQSHIKALIAAEDFGPALDLVQSTRHILNTQLKGVSSLKHIDVKLHEMMVLIEKLLCAELEQLCVHGSPSTQGTATHATPLDSLRAYAEVSDVDKHEIFQSARNIDRIGKLAVFTPQFRAGITAVITKSLKELVLWQLREQTADVSSSEEEPASSESTDEEEDDEHKTSPQPHTQAPTSAPIGSSSGSAGTRMARQLRELSHSSFVLLLQRVLGGVMHIVRRMCAILSAFKEYVSVMNSGGSLPDPTAPLTLDAPQSTPPPQPSSSSSSSSSSSPSPSSTEDELRVAFVKDMQEVVCNMTEFAHSRLARIIGIRAEVHAELKLDELRELFEVSLKFVVDCETLCGKTFYGLRGTLLVQANAFLTQLHKATLNRLTSCLEREHWTQAKVPRRYQILIDRQFRRRRADPIKFSKDSETAVDKTYSNWDELSDEENESHGKAAAGSEEKSSRVIFVVAVDPITGKKKGTFDKYSVVNSLLELLDIITSYIDCAARLPAVGAEVVNKLVEVLKVFNSRTCQLVLGAGAMHLAGLKSINAKHLALSAQCLGMISSQIPVIRKALAARLPAKHHVLLDAMERVRVDYRNHQQEILEKLVSIVKSLVESTCKTLLKTDWASATDDSQITVKKIKADSCIRTLMKQTASLHKVLSELLPTQQRDQVYVSISKEFSQLLCQYLSRIASTSSYVQKQVAVNVQHVLKRLRSLDGVGPSTCKELEVFL